MRLASRIIGGFMIFAAISFFAIFSFIVLSGGWNVPAVPRWNAAGFFLILAIGFFLGGRSYLRYDPEAREKEEPPSETTRFIIRHRAQLRVIAQIGLVLSLTRVAAAFVHSDWLGPYSTLWLAAGAVVLIYWGRKMASPNVTDNSDWQRVPEWIRRALPAAWLVAFWGSIILWGARQWFHIRAATDNGVYATADRVVSGVSLSVLYAIEALYFPYGELRPANGTGTAE